MTTKTNEEKLQFLYALYVELSSIEDNFPKNSKHKACLKINKRMSEILNEIETLKNVSEL